MTDARNRNEAIWKISTSNFKLSSAYIEKNINKNKKFRNKMKHIRHHGLENISHIKTLQKCGSGRLRYGQVVLFVTYTTSFASSRERKN